MEAELELLYTGAAVLTLIEGTEVTEEYVGSVMEGAAVELLVPFP